MAKRGVSFCHFFATVDYRCLDSFAGLREIGWGGHFTIHQAEGIKTTDDARSYANRCAKFVKRNET